MPENLDLDLFLAGHDAAPDGELTAAELERRERLLGSLLAGERSRRRSRAPRSRAVWAGVAVVATCAAAYGAVTLNGGSAAPERGVALTKPEAGGSSAAAASPSASPSASAATAPSHIDPRCLAWADGLPVGKDAPAVAVTATGKALGEIVLAGGKAYACEVNGDGSGGFELLGPAAVDVAAKQLVLGPGRSEASRTGSGAGTSFTVGRVGTGIRSVVLRLPDGRGVATRVQNHWLMAVWTSTSTGPDITSGTVTYTDGTTHPLPQSVLGDQ
ncbi:hypothetical protein [Actinacidiphila yeochonensis]|uniref:hypothetical protein n=1 Tax=Actinacidiphila yeochonensis TaxID=89050 RepID=UPI000567D2EC|nr:hypothetical protein [Actinacidiphila yeochonensis]